MGLCALFKSPHAITRSTFRGAEKWRYRWISRFRTCLTPKTLKRRHSAIQSARSPQRSHCALSCVRDSGPEAIAGTQDHQCAHRRHDTSPFACLRHRVRRRRRRRASRCLCPRGAAAGRHRAPGQRACCRIDAIRVTHAFFNPRRKRMGRHSHPAQKRPALGLRVQIRCAEWRLLFVDPDGQHRGLWLPGRCDRGWDRARQIAGCMACRCAERQLPLTAPLGRARWASAPKADTPIMASNAIPMSDPMRSIAKVRHGFC